jgi:hypothetical protein
MVYYDFAKVIAVQSEHLSIFSALGTALSVCHSTIGQYACNIKGMKDGHFPILTISSRENATATTQNENKFIGGLSCFEKKFSLFVFPDFTLLFQELEVLVAKMLE